MEKIKQELRSFFKENFIIESDSLDDDLSLLDSGMIDSTGILEVIAFLEEHFEIKIDDDEILPENLDSINKIGVYIQKKTAA